MPRSGKVSLLIVEDDATIRFLLEAAARRTGIFEPVATEPDGRAALELLQGCDTVALPALIVTDLTMPRMSGLELLRAIKCDGRMRHIPVAVITSSELPDDRILALAAGAGAFVAKPYGLDALIRALVGIHDSCAEPVNAASSGYLDQAAERNRATI